MDITDGVFILNFLFLGGAAPTCGDSADTDDNGGIDISDGVLIFNFLFLGGNPPVAPYPDCGADTMADDGLDSDSACKPHGKGAY